MKGQTSRYTTAKNLSCDHKLEVINERAALFTNTSIPIQKANLMNLNYHLHKSKKLSDQRSIILPTRKKTRYPMILTAFKSKKPY